MSALTVWQGIEERMRTIEGIQAIILGDPTSIHDAPAIIVAYGSLDRVLQNSGPAQNLTGTTHEFGIRLAIKWQDNPNAEMELIALADAIPDAIGADPKLGRRITSGFARISGGVTTYVDYGTTKFRILDFTCSVLEKV